SRSKSQSLVIQNSLIPNGIDSEQDSFFSVQAAGQIKFESYLLEQVNSLFLPKFAIATTEISTTDIRQEKLTLQSEKSLNKNHKQFYYPKVNRSNLIVNSIEGNTFSNQLSLVNPAPETKQITSSFGWRVRPFSGQRQFHQGIDYGAPLGSPVVAAGDGIVTKVVSGCADFRNISCGQQFGNRIEIDHGNGAIATYGHLLNNSIKITEGTKVWQNQEIAQVGSSGWSSGAHLDFRIKVNGEFQDPARFIK
ncbi:MAG: M23 family metallopeptidase, partial [Cyanobacteria bacterium P01_F01_bin.143]